MKLLLLRLSFRGSDGGYPWRAHRARAADGVGGELLSCYGGSLSYAEQVVANAVLGGVVSELGGGKFANGAMTAAYTMMFNDLAHIGPTYKQLEKIMKIYKACKSLYDTPEAFYESLGGAAYLYYWNTDGRHSSITTELWKYGK